MSHLPAQKASACRLFGLGVFAVAIGLACVLPGFGQVSPDEHAKHHPGQDTEKDKGGMSGMAPSEKGSEKGMSGGMEGMKGMMEGMGKPPPKELYPTLMNLPELTKEKRDEILGQAHERMRSGVALLSKGLDDLADAADDDYKKMQAGTAQMREGLARFESGLAAKRALAEGKPPSQVALRWFKNEMNLQPPQGVETRGVSGVSLFHLFTMILLIAFALAMVAMYFFKMRRAAALFERIESDSGSPPPGSAKPLAGPPAADAKAKPPAADAKASPEIGRASCRERV